MRHPVLTLCVILLLASCARQAAPPAKPAEPPAAILDEMVGDVTVDGKPAQLGMELTPGMTIATGPGGKANALLYKGIAVRIAENTTVTVGSLSRQSVRLSQLAGTTWSKILKIAGVQDYTLQTPFTTATVRGTAFAVKVTAAHAVVKVAEGTVAADFEGKVTLVEEEHQVMATEETFAFETYETDSWVEENTALDEEFVEEVAEDFLEEHTAEYQEASEDLGVPLDELEEWAEAYVEGEVTDIVPETTEELESIEEAPAEEPAAEEFPPEEPVMETMPMEEMPPEEPFPETFQKQPLEEQVQEPLMDQPIDEQMTDEQTRDYVISQETG